jgi:hypothetical protein
VGKKVPCSENVGKKFKKTDTFLKRATFWDMKNDNAKSPRQHQPFPLPFQRSRRCVCCFINPKTFEPIIDQWNFLKNIKRVATNHLDELYDGLKSGIESNTPIATNGKLNIYLNNQVRLSRVGLTTTLINFLKEELNFANSEFFIKKKSGRNTFETARYFKLVEETESEIFIPRGFIGKLLRFCKESQIEFYFIDKRKLKPSIPFAFNAALRNHQLGVNETFSKKDYGVIVAPPGSGKTIIDLKKKKK